MAAAVIFDFEGTLVDFQWQLAAAEEELRHSFATLGLAGAAYATGSYSSMWNAAVAELAPQGRLSELRQCLYPIYDRWDADALTRWQPRAGAAAVLHHLASQKLRVGLVSNIGSAALRPALQRFGFADWLDAVVARDDVELMKPAAEGIRRLLRNWGLAPADALFIGDSRADVLAARAAGTQVLIIRGGECGAQAFADSPPDRYIDVLGQLIAPS